MLSTVDITTEHIGRDYENNRWTPNYPGKWHFPPLQLKNFWAPDLGDIMDSILYNFLNPLKPEQELPFYEITIRQLNIWPDQNLQTEDAFKRGKAEM